MSTNVTVNGRPLEEHLNEQTAAELKEAIESDSTVRLRKAAACHKVRNHSRGRSGKIRILLKADPKTTHLIICGIKAPVEEKIIHGFEPAGHSLYGALEFDERTDKVKCHACGNWFQSIPVHVGMQKAVSSVHSTIRNYKLRYGFRLNRSPLSVPSLVSKQRANCVRQGNNRAHDMTNARKALKKRLQHPEAYAFTRGRTESRNAINNCRAQRLVELKAFAGRLGRTPTTKELAEFVNSHGEHSLRHSTLEFIFELPMRSIFLQAGLKPRATGYSRTLLSGKRSYA